MDKSPQLLLVPSNRCSRWSEKGMAVVVQGCWCRRGRQRRWRWRRRRGRQKNNVNWNQYTSTTGVPSLSGLCCTYCTCREGVWPEKKLMYCIAVLARRGAVFCLIKSALDSFSREKILCHHHDILPRAHGSAHSSCTTIYCTALYVAQTTTWTFFLQFPPCGGLICCKFHHLVI